MGNLYDYFMSLIGIVDGMTGYNSNVVYCCCICVVVLFCLACKLIFRGFDRLLGYNKIL